MSMRPRTGDNGAVYRRYISAVVLHGMAIADAVGLNATDAYAFSVLELAGRMTSGELAARTGLSTGAATRMIDRLEGHGLVQRTTDPADRRKVIVTPIRPPADIDAALEPARHRIAEIFDGYTEEQLSTLFDYFARAAVAFEETTEQTRSRAP